MMSTIPLEQAQNQLADVISRLRAGDEVTITVNECPVARLVGVAATTREQRTRPPVTGTPKAGQYEGRLVVPDDFDEPLEELREYME
jgi:prevent-host-death family protein